MKKTLALVAIGVIGLAVLAKTTNVSSYVSTLWSQARVAAKQSVPTKFEIDRIRNDIASLDQDLDRMIRPIAEHKVNVEKLRKDVVRDEEKLAEQKKVLLDATAAVKAAKKGDTLIYGAKGFTVEQVKTRIGIDFKSYERFEANVSAQKKLLESKEGTLRAAQEQLTTFISKKREFEVQLAQLEAENEINQVAAVGTSRSIPPASPRLPSRSANCGKRSRRTAWCLKWWLSSGMRTTFSSASRSRAWPWTWTLSRPTSRAAATPPPRPLRRSTTSRIVEQDSDPA